MTKTNTFRMLRGIRRSKYSTGDAQTLLLGKRISDELWTVIATEISADEKAARVDVNRIIVEYNLSHYPYRWLGCLDDDSIRRTFAKVPMS
jgi:hypothetical protein